MKRTKGERLGISFNRKIKLEFHGARLTSWYKNCLGTALLCKTEG